MVEKNNYKNLSVSICVDTEKLGEIIHWQKTGLLEAWHYKNLFGRCETTVDIAFFNEKDIRAAVEFAKYGEPSAYAIETKNNKSLKNKKD